MHEDKQVGSNALHACRKSAPIAVCRRLETCRITCQSLTKTTTYIQAINDDFVDSVLIGGHSCGNLPPVPQPCVLTLCDEGWVGVELVVQHHIEAVARKEVDDEHVAFKAGGEGVQVVAADAFSCWRGILHTKKLQDEALHSANAPMYCREAAINEQVLAAATAEMNRLKRASLPRREPLWLETVVGAAGGIPHRAGTMCRVLHVQGS